MRLTPAQIDTIKSTAKAVLGDGAQVTLFRSRVHDIATGGDVDIDDRGLTPIYTCQRLT